MTEKELALKHITDCENRLKDDMFPAVILDKKNFFSKTYNLEQYTIECNQRGYDILPLEETILYQMPLIGKLVVIKQGFNTQAALNRFVK